MTLRALDVRNNGHLVGQLREDHDIWEFAYAESWQALSSGFDLSPWLPKSRALHRDGSTNRSLQWYFDNLLPEEAMRAIVARDAGIRPEDVFGLLHYYGRESAGSLVLEPPGAHPLHVQHGLQPLSKADLSRRIAEMPRVSLGSRAPKKMSLAGAQNKLLVVMQGEELFEPQFDTASTFILKPNHESDDYPASVMNEYFTMRLAKAVGLDVPEVKRIYVPQPVYLVARFDRVIADKSEATRLHAIDACQLLNKPRTFKYTAANAAALSDAIQLCRQRAGARITLFKWLAFNLLVGNGDNHLKNISFLVEREDIRPAPAYDLLSTAVYDTGALADARARWPNTPLALTIGNARTFADLTRADVLDAAGAMGLSDMTAERELDRLIRVLPVAADKLIDDIIANHPADLAASPDAAASRPYLEGEQRLLRAIRHIVIADMTTSLAAS